MSIVIWSVFSSEGNKHGNEHRYMELGFLSGAILNLMETVTDMEPGV